ncbi:MAG: alpha/beta fold hydrolase [Anaerolineales bacterium]
MNKQTAQIMFVVLAVALFGLMLAACGGSDVARTVPEGAKPGDLTLEPCKFKWNDDEYDMVGYRGVDGSVVLDCPEVERANKGVGDNLLSPESRANLGDAARQCAQRLQAEGVDLDGYTIPEVVADLEAARAGLGYERVNLGSLSYGTRIAQIYAYLHPDRVYRSIMAGVNPPGHFVYEPETIDAQLEYYAQLCAQDAECSARTPNLAETMRHVAHNLPERWLFIPIDPGAVKVITFFQLFNRGTAAIIFDAYLAAEQGDPSGLAWMSLTYDLFTSDMTWGERSAIVFSADYDPSRDYVAEMDPPDSILGSPLSLLQWSSAASWPTQQLIPAELRRVQPSDVETLLVSGSVDFSTPAEFATDELLPYLTNGEQAILAEMGHVNDVGTLQPAAFERLATSFYDTGVADDSLYTYAPMDFGVSLGFPALAKIVLGIVLLLIAVVVVVIWFIVRRIRRRMARRRSLDAA